MSGVNAKAVLLIVISINVVCIAAIVVYRIAPLFGEVLWSSLALDSHEQQLQISRTTATREELVPPRPEGVAVVSNGRSSATADSIAHLQTIAFDIAESTLRDLPRVAEAHCLLGRLHTRAVQPEVARELWRRALRLDPTCVDAFIDLGQAALNAGDFEEAEKHLRKAVKLDPKNEDACLTLSEVLLATSNWKEVVRCLSGLIGTASESAIVWSDLARAHSQIGNQEAAVRAYAHALRLQPNSRKALAGLIAIHRKRGDDDQAALYATKLKEVEQAADRIAENRDVARRDLYKMRELVVYTAVQASSLLLREKLPQEAVGHLRRAKSVAPDAVALRAQLAHCHAVQGNAEAAIDVYRQFLSRNPPDTLVVWREMAELALRLRRLDSAEHALQEIIRLEPDDDWAYAMLAQSQMPSTRAPRAAVENARKAVERAPTASNHYILGTAYYHNKDFSRARDALRSAIELEPENAEYRRALEHVTGLEASANESG